MEPVLLPVLKRYSGHWSGLDSATMRPATSGMMAKNKEFSHKYGKWVVTT